MERWFRMARMTTVVGLLSVVAGALLLMVYAASEVAADPSLSLADGYWIGRLPWTAVGVDLVVIGATVAVVAGTVAVWLAGGWISRAVSALAAAVAAFWWFLAMALDPGGGYCPDCPAQGPDPFAMAYSLPSQTLAFLVVPAVVIGITAIAASPRRYTPAATPSNQANAT